MNNNYYALTVLREDGLELVFLDEDVQIIFSDNTTREKHTKIGSRQRSDACNPNEIYAA